MMDNMNICMSPHLFVNKNSAVAVDPRDPRACDSSSLRPTHGVLNAA